jgi:hypothetical protein
MNDSKADSGAAVPCISLLAAADALLKAAEDHIKQAEEGDASDWIESAETLEDAMQVYRDARKANNRLTDQSQSKEAQP